MVSCVVPVANLTHTSILYEEGSQIIFVFAQTPGEQAAHQPAVTLLMLLLVQHH